MPLCPTDRGFHPSAPRLAQGMLLRSFVARIIGSDFPGAGTVLVSYSLRFRRPVFVDEGVVGVAVAEAVEEREGCVWRSR